MCDFGQQSKSYQSLIENEDVSIYQLAQRKYDVQCLAHVGKIQLVIIVVALAVVSNITFGAGNNCRIKFFKILHFIEQTIEFKRSKDTY